MDPNLAEQNEAPATPASEMTIDVTPVDTSHRISLADYKTEDGTLTGPAEPVTPAADEGKPGDPPEAPSSDDADAKPKGASEQEEVGKVPEVNPLEAALATERAARQELEARLARLEKPETKVDQPSDSESGDKAPDPKDYEFGEADGKFIADHARYHAVKAYREEQERAEFKQEFDAMEDAWQATTSSQETAELYPDFAEKVTKGAERGDWDLSPIGALLVKNSEVGRDVAYYLATNPAESKRIAALNPNKQMLEFGRLEGRFLHSEKPAPEAAPVKPVKVATDAPPPPEKTRGAGGKFANTEAEQYRKMLREFN